jgi:single-strand DNA-binding protein
MNLNKIFLIGRLTQDPEMRSTPSGQTVTTIRLATNRVWSDPSGRKEATEYHQVVAWGRLGEIASQYLKRGGLVMIEGRMQTRSWNDQQGNKKYMTEVVAEGLQLGPRTGDTGGGRGGYTNDAPPAAQSSRPAPAAATSRPAVQEDEIPIIGEDEPMNSGVEEADVKIKEEDLPF